MAALVAAVLVAQPASAALLTYEATGVVDFLYNNPGNPLPQTWSESGLGQRLTVDFTIDTATPVSGIFTNTVGGPVTGNSYARGAVTVTATLGSTSVSLGPQTVTILNGNFVNSTYGYQTSFATGPTNYLPDSPVLSLFTIVDSRTAEPIALYPDTSLLNAAPLTPAQLAYAASLGAVVATNLLIYLPGGQSGPYSQVQVGAFSVSPVPLPATVWLLLSGLGGLGGLGAMACTIKVKKLAAA